MQISESKRLIIAADKDPIVVIPVCLPLRRKGAGIRVGTGCRIKACPGPDPGSGMTELAI